MTDNGIILGLAGLFTTVGYYVIYLILQRKINSVNQNEYAKSVSKDLIKLVEDNNKLLAINIEYRDHYRFTSNLTSMKLMSSILISLIENKDILITNEHYILLFNAFVHIQNDEQAIKYINIAIEKSEKINDKVENLLRLADFYYIRYKKSSGMKTYKKAIGLLKGNADDIQYKKGNAYINWYVNEARISSIENAERYYNEAKKCFSKCKNNHIKDFGIKYLESKKRFITTGNSYPSETNLLNKFMRK